MCSPGDHVLIPDDAYGGTYRLFARVLAGWGLSHDVIAMSDLAAVRERLAAGPVKMIWIETPTNPLLSIADIRALAGVAHEAGAMLVVDNTFASPYLQQPLALGADVVVHSTTKYLGGHSDVIGGAVVVADPELAERLAFTRNATGGVPGPFDAWLTLRGIKTLAVRMDRHCRNAMRVAQMLAEHPAVAEVFYPGLPAHPGHKTAQEQMRAFGGMVSFRLLAGEEAAVRVCGRTRLFTLGGVARRRRVADRASGPDDARLRRRLGAGGPGRPDPAVGRHRGLRRPARRPAPGPAVRPRRCGKTSAVTQAPASRPGDAGAERAGLRPSAFPGGRAFPVVGGQRLRLGLVGQGEPGADREDDAHHEASRSPAAGDGRSSPAMCPGRKLGSDFAGSAR